MRLFTYTIRIDDGAAPNPFGGICTLVICKPAIRRVARVGDWIAGFGSKHAPGGDLSGKLVYAMKVTEVLTMREYDRLAPSRWPCKIPDIKSPELFRRLGDCLYDYSTGSPVQRQGVHRPANARVDLSGRNALVSDHFFYFGSKAIPLPPELAPILHQQRGHKSKSNEPYVEAFIEWIDSLDFEPGQIYGMPGYVVSWSNPEECALDFQRMKDKQDGVE